MREIKFRAFDNLKKEMIYKVSVFESCAFKNNVHLPTLNGDRNYFINQFTGLLDKDGTEIYEGDIISMSAKKPVAVIDYEYCGFVLKWIDKIYLQVRPFEKEPIFRNIHLFKVMGNIYENPEIIIKQHERK